MPPPPNATPPVRSRPSIRAPRCPFRLGSATSPRGRPRIDPTSPTPPARRNCASRRTRAVPRPTSPSEEGDDGHEPPRDRTPGRDARNHVATKVPERTVGSAYRVPVSMSGPSRRPKTPCRAAHGPGSESTRPARRRPKSPSHRARGRIRLAADVPATIHAPARQSFRGSPSPRGSRNRAAPDRSSSRPAPKGRLGRDAPRLDGVLSPPLRSDHPIGRSENRPRTRSHHPSGDTASGEHVAPHRKVRSRNFSLPDRDPLPGASAASGNRLPKKPPPEALVATQNWSRRQRVQTDSRRKTEAGKKTRARSNKTMRKPNVR